MGAVPLGKCPICVGERVCGAAVGSALDPQLGKHLENRAVEEAGAISEMCL